MNVVINSPLKANPSDSVLIPGQQDYYCNILACLGYSIAELPVADLLRRLHGWADEGLWLIVSPMHWQATHNDAMMTAAGADLLLTEDEGRAWFDAFATFAETDTIKMYYHDASTWLIQLTNYSPITARPVYTSLHQSMMPQLETLDHTLFWQRFMTESQMFLSGHVLNQARQGRCVINGIWIWGGGRIHISDHHNILIDNDNLLPFATLLSTRVMMYSAKQQVPDETLILWHDVGSLPMLQQQLKKRTVAWYWNNQAYLLKPKHWWQRFWRTIRHAD